jgi:hypothetical protein
MKYRLLIIVCTMTLLMFCISCDLSKPEDVNKAQIEQILEQMKVDFRQLDLQAVMSVYSPNYYHNGTGLSAEGAKWQQRMNQYSSFDFINLNYDINDDTAVVSGFAKWYTESEVETTAEPADNGDFSYFIKEQGIWRIYGNQHPAVSPTVPPNSGGHIVPPSSGGSCVTPTVPMSIFEVLADMLCCKLF